MSRVFKVEYSEYFKCALGAVSGFVNYVGVANLGARGRLEAAS